MKFKSSSQAIKYKNNDTCVAYEYPLSDPDINAVIVKLTGRYPDTGRTVNTRCKELVYVIEGKGFVSIEDKKIKINRGDVILIETGEKFYWEGNLTMFMPCTPAWTAKQHRFVP